LKVIKTIREINGEVAKYKKNFFSIGFIPTMGALHEGHLSLIKESIRNNDKTIVSIFVNPLQFGPSEDYSKYPRILEHDSLLCEKIGVDLIFAPAENSFYSDPHLTTVSVGKITEKLCGVRRPGHFDGVCTVVTKLFNIVKPDHAYFGKKDFQQLRIIKKMVEDLSIPVKIHACEIVREESGLALSSRNKYLAGEDRSDASLLYQSLFQAKKQIMEGKRDSSTIQKIIENILQSGKNLKIDYIAIVDQYLFDPVETINNDTLIALACFIGKTRLIDNILCADFL